jgi:RNA polymerase sigma-B factor
MSDARKRSHRPFDDDMRARFAAYRETRDRSLRNELVEEHRWVAELAARRFANRGEPLDDLLQVAFLGLVKAIERFDPQLGTAFASFALPTLFGELRRHFRDTTWSVHVTRRAKELHLEMGGVVERLTTELGRSPRPEEVARAMDATIDEVIHATEAGNAYRSASLDTSAFDQEPGGPRGHDSARLSKDDANLVGADLRVVVASLLEGLDPRERRIVELRFFAERTQSEIAAEMGISQVHVSRLLRASFERMQAVLREDVAV